MPEATAATGDCKAEPLPRQELRERLRSFSVQRGLGRAYPPILPSNDGKIGGMAKRKTSVAFDDDTLAILARRADEAHLDRSAYLTELIKRDDLRRRIAIDSANLDAAGYTSDRRIGDNVGDPDTPSGSPVVAVPHLVKVWHAPRGSILPGGMLCLIVSSDDFNRIRRRSHRSSRLFMPIWPGVMPSCAILVGSVLP